MNVSYKKLKKSQYGKIIRDMTQSIGIPTYINTGVDVAASQDSKKQSQSHSLFLEVKTPTVKNIWIRKKPAI